MFLCSLIEGLCTKEENDKTGCNLSVVCMYVHPNYSRLSLEDFELSGLHCFPSKLNCFKAVCLQNFPIELQLLKFL